MHHVNALSSSPIKKEEKKKPDPNPILLYGNSQLDLQLHVISPNSPTTSPSSITFHPHPPMSYPERFQGFAINDPKDWATPKLTSFEPKAFGPHDVDIEVECCGICASELFALKNEWGHAPLACLSSKYGPKTQVVGHEVVGKVVAVGPQVSLCNVGDRVGLGAQASACMQCSRCNSGNEQYCPNAISTYCKPYPDGYVSQGGYASHVRAHEQFCFPIPPEIPSELVAPLQCGGLTVFSPIKRNLQGKHLSLIHI